MVFVIYINEFKEVLFCVLEYRDNYFFNYYDLSYYSNEGTSAAKIFLFEVWNENEDRGLLSLFIARKKCLLDSLLLVISILKILKNFESYSFNQQNIPIDLILHTPEE